MDRADAVEGATPSHRLIRTYACPVPRTGGEPGRRWPGRNDHGTMIISGVPWSVGHGNPVLTMGIPGLDERRRVAATGDPSTG